MAGAGNCPGHCISGPRIGAKKALTSGLQHAFGAMVMHNNGARHRQKQRYPGFFKSKRITIM